MIAAARIFAMIDRKPSIDSASGSGLRLNKVDGEAELKDATFSYPTRKTVNVLRNLDLRYSKETFSGEVVLKLFFIAVSSLGNPLLWLDNQDVASPQ